MTTWSCSSQFVYIVFSNSKNVKCLWLVVVLQNKKKDRIKRRSKLLLFIPKIVNKRKFSTQCITVYRFNVQWCLNEIQWVWWFENNYRIQQIINSDDQINFWWKYCACVLWFTVCRTNKKPETNKSKKNNKKTEKRIESTQNGRQFGHGGIDSHCQ